MGQTAFAAAIAVAVTMVATSPVLALRGGGGGDREPAGGAFMSSYPEPGSARIQRGEPPRSVDVPRDAYGRPIGRMPWAYGWR